MKSAQTEELQYFYLKYVHTMNKIRVLLRDAACIEKHLKNLESGNLTDVDLYKLWEDKKECRT